MIHNYKATYQNIMLRPLMEEDIENLRIWRNDIEKTKYLRKIGTITPEMQKEWFEKYQQDTNQIIFAIEEIRDLKRMVGSLALYNFKDNIAEIGKIQIGDTQANGQGIGRKSTVMAAYIGFQKLGLKKIISSVNPENIAAYKNNLRAGFQIIGEHSYMNGIEKEIEIDLERLKEANQFLIEIDI